MKTKMKIKNVGLALATLFLMLFSVASYAQPCAGNNVTVTIQNFSNPAPTSTTIEFDVYIQNTSTNTIKLASLAGAVFYNFGSGVTGTFSVVSQPSANDFPGFLNCGPGHTPASNQMRWTNNAVAENLAIDLPVGGPAKKFARFRFVKTGTPIPNNFPLTLTFAEYVQTGVTAVNPNVYCNGNPSTAALANGTFPTNNGYLVVGGPYNYTINLGGEICATSGSQTGSAAPTCAGQSNGSTTITMAPVPTVLAGTYSLDGGPATPVTLSAGGAFTISGLTAGAHTVTYTGSPACNTPITVSGVSVPAGAPLTTDGSITTTQCDSYTWPAPGSGLTYTSSQTNLTFVSGCNTATLNLTINNSTSHTTNATACDTYTWSAPLGNGQTYTTSQTGLTNTSTNAAGCPHVETLNLTINSSTSHTTNATACDSFTWSAPLGNGTTYTSSVSGVTNTSTNAAGCPHVETLNLTINASTSGTTTATACDSYVWAAPLGNGQTYTASNSTATNVTTNAAGCPHTQTLNLTINASTSGTTTATACDSYVWAGPLGNGQTYTASNNTATNVTLNAAGCNHTQTLNLTINNSTSGTTTATACDSYVWAGPLGNGQTYTSSNNTATFVSTNAAGCSHTQTLNLTINASTSGTTTATACDSYVWAAPLGNGQTYTASNSTATNVTTNAAGCPHTQTLNLTINASTSGTTTATACDSYVWAGPLGNGQTYTASNNTATNVTLNAAGCNHTQTLNLTINASTAHTTTVTACTSYTWSAPLGNGQTYTSSVSGVTNTSTNAAGCPHVETLNLTISNNTTGTTNATACDTYTWSGPLGNGQTYTASGTYTSVTSIGAGCTHTETLNLTINNSTSGTTTATACNSYVWAAPLGNGQTYTSSNNTATNVSTNAAGCPHTQTLNLTINVSTTGTTNATACDTYTWAAPLGNSQTYTTSQTGLTNVSTNAAGCSHTQTLNLTINASTSGTTTATACDSYVWAAPLGNGQTYTASNNTATFVSTNAAGCPNTQTLNLTINNSTLHTTVATACDSYTWAAPLGNGVTYTASIMGATNITTNAAGCPHTEKLNLTINNSTTNGSISTSASGSYTWPLPLGTGLTYTASGTYTNVTTNAAGCPNTATLNLTILTGTVNTFTIGPSCGATITNLSVTINATPVSGASTYTFRLTNMATSAVQIINRPVNSFALSNYPGITLGTQYQVEVSTNLTPYGPPCIVYTPAPVSNIGAHCGTTLTSMTQFVYATYVASATGYRFRITNNTTSAVQIFDSSLNRFSFSQLPNRSFGTTYFVEVALRNTDGSYLPYNVGCNVSTPAFPTTSLQASQCSYTAPSNKENIYATVVSGATMYRFLLSRTTAPTYSSFVDRPLSSFTLSMFTGLTAGTAYSVQVAVMIDGVWGPYGSVCTVTTPGTVRVNAASMAFKAIAYPNPFASDFKFDITTTSDSTVQIRVYDMLGKQVENRNVEVTDLESLQVGANYPSGVYNVIVSQGENTQTLRVIKR